MIGSLYKNNAKKVVVYICKKKLFWIKLYQTRSGKISQTISSYIHGQMKYTIHDKMKADKSISQIKIQQSRIFTKTMLKRCKLYLFTYIPVPKNK